MIRQISQLAFIANTLSFNTNDNYPVSTYKSVDYDNMISFLHKINEGTMIVYDMCETLDETYSILSGTNKPDCNYNISYINNTDIVIHPPNPKIVEFFKLEKKMFCKKEHIECGELTLILKLANLIESGIILAMENNLDDLWINLEIIDFNEMYNLYKTSLTNAELLTNITLSKQKSNVLLTQEKYRLNKILSKTYFSSFTDKVEIWLGDPIKDSFIYVGRTLGETFGTLLDKTLPEISLEFKLIVILCLVIYIRK